VKLTRPFIIRKKTVGSSDKLGISEGCIEGFCEGLGLGFGLSVGSQETSMDGCAEGDPLGTSENDGLLEGVRDIDGLAEGKADGLGLGAGESVGDLDEVEGSVFSSLISTERKANMERVPPA
jgi:hypothetical protein